MATSAQIQYTTGNSTTWGLATDAAGNLYISDNINLHVRKVDVNGIISTIAGDGGQDTIGLGGPAVSTGVYFPEGLTTDLNGNLYIAEWQNCVLTAVNPAGMLNTVAGNYTIDFTGDGGPATSAALNAVSDVAIDQYGNIYIADCHNSRIRKVTGSYLSGTYVTDSFGVFINMLCSGPAITVSTQTYDPSYSLRCNYGDGTTDVASLTPGMGNSGVASFTHAYSAPGHYTIKTTLLNNNVPFDSVSYDYEFKLCNTLSNQYFHDANGNCIFDNGDNLSQLPILTEVDSNGIAIDTISSTSGIYYTAHGMPGDVYSFRIISPPPGMHVACPISGIVYDTLSITSYNTNLNSVAFECNTISTYDLQINAIVPVTGINDQWGNIYVRNTHCAPQNAIVTLHYDQHYQATAGSTNPAASSFTDSTITWNLSALSAADAAPVDLWYAIWRHPDSAIVVGYPAKSYFTVSPTNNDADISNNSQIQTDSVDGGVDPNEIQVSPQGSILPGTKLRYTINFTNTGNDTTYNIYVMDTLSDHLDISTFRMVMATNNMNVVKYQSGGHNILKFDFPNVNLLDSMHHPMDCHGGLIYEINAKNGLPFGTQIFNHAGIFFDFNPVVTTNTVLSTIGWPADLTESAIKNNDIVIYPNPVGPQITIDQVPFPSDYVISNIVGIKVKEGSLNKGSNRIQINELPKGMYYIKVNGADIRKFVKL